MRILYYSKLINHACGASVHGRQFFSTAKKMRIEIESFPKFSEKLIPINNVFSRREKLSSILSPTFVELMVGGKRFIDSKIIYKKLLQIHKHFQYDLILMRLQNMDWACKYACDQLGIPLILEVNSMLQYEVSQLHGKSRLGLLGKFEKNHLKYSKRIITVSNILKEYVVSLGICPENVSVNPNGVDITLFHPEIDGSATRRQLGVDDKKVIIFSGSPMPWHDVEILIRILPKLGNDIVLLVIGDSPFLKKLIILAENENISNRVIFMGQVPYDEVPLYLAAGDVFVATYKPHEFFYFSPIKILEYMAMGKVIVATDIGQISGLLAEGRGILLPPGDETHLIEGLNKALSSGEYSLRMGKLARQYVMENFTWEQNAQKVIAVCKNCLIEGG